MLGTPRLAIHHTASSMYPCDAGALTHDMLHVQEAINDIGFWFVQVHHSNLKHQLMALVQSAPIWHTCNSSAGKTLSASLCT